MKQYLLRRGAGIAGLQRVERESTELAAHDVRVRIGAVSLNYRDLLIAAHGPGDGPQFVPCSDGAGTVVAVGSEVTRLRVGDRVSASFFPAWLDGEPTPENTLAGLGGGGIGMLAEEVTLPESALFVIPAHLDDVAASTLACAGVTAWHALFRLGELRPGSTVLLLGTGGVSIWALQLAKAAGLRVVITSSDDRKLDRALQLGADATINYRTHPDWAAAALALTGGRGVDRVLEIGGRDTLRQSIAATRMGGRIAIIGGTTGFGGELEPFVLTDGAKHLSGVLVGSRAMAEELATFVAAHRLQPIVDRVFGFDEAREAYAYLESAGHFGKVVVAVDSAAGDRTSSAPNGSVTTA